MAQRAQGSVYLKPIVKKSAKVQESGCQVDMPNLGEKGRTLMRRGAVVARSHWSSSGRRQLLHPPSYAHTCPQVCYIIGEKPGEVLRLCTFQ